MQRKFGVEFEFNNDKFDDDSDEKIKDTIKKSVKLHFNKKNVQILKTSSPSYWGLFLDLCGYEITTPAIKSSIENINNISNIAKDIYDTYKNKISFYDCGLHVHIDIRDFDQTQIQNIYKTFFKFEKPILSLLRKERTNNWHIEPLRKNINVIDICGYGKFDINNKLYKKHSLAINLRSNKHVKTEHIEIRYCHGTLNPDTIKNWVILMVILVEISKTTEIDEKTILKKSTISDMITHINDSYFLRKDLFNYKNDIIKWIDKRLLHRNHI